MACSRIELRTENTGFLKHLIVLFSCCSRFSLPKSGHIIAGGGHWPLYTGFQQGTDQLEGHARLTDKVNFFVQFQFSCSCLYSTPSESRHHADTASSLVILFRPLTTISAPELARLEAWPQIEYCREVGMSASTLHNASGMQEPCAITSLDYRTAEGSLVILVSPTSIRSASIRRQAVFCIYMFVAPLSVGK